jgi:Glycosyl transferase family 2
LVLIQSRLGTLVALSGNAFPQAMVLATVRTVPDRGSPIGRQAGQADLDWVNVPTIDVLIPTRNRPTLAIRAVLSVVEQSVRARVVVVDDCSDEASYAQLARQVAELDEVSLLRSTERLGPALARQFALEHSSAEWVATLDSDDEWLPGKLEKQMERLEQTGADVALCWFAWVRPDGSVRVTRRPVGEGRVSPTLTNNIDTPLARRAVIERIGAYRGDASSPLHCDEHTDFMIRLLGSATVTVVPEVLVHCHDHDGARASDDVSRQVDSMRSIVTARRHLFTGFEDDLSELEARFAARLLASGAKRKGVAELSSAIRAASWPRRWSLAKQYAPFTAKSLLRRSGSSTVESATGA